MRCELRNFVQAHARIKWCPAPACTSAVMVSEGWEGACTAVASRMAAHSPLTPPTFRHCDDRQVR